MNNKDKIQQLMDLYPHKTRYDCINCGGSNTLSISKIDNEIRYFCFRASCDLKGIISSVMGTNQAQNLAKCIHTSSSYLPSQFMPEFQIPDYWTGINAKGYAYEVSINSYEHLCKYYYTTRIGPSFVISKYDIKEDRYVFLVRDNYGTGKVVDAIGRYLGVDRHKDANIEAGYMYFPPKWKIYGTKQYPFFCGNKDTCVIVEDAASAVRVSSIATGMALMGTDLNGAWLPLLGKFKKVIICLDQDAYMKAIKMAKKVLWQCTKSYAVSIPKDIKDMTDKELQDYVGRYV